MINFPKRIYVDEILDPSVSLEGHLDISRHESTDVIGIYELVCVGKVRVTTTRV